MSLMTATRIPAASVAPVRTNSHIFGGTELTLTSLRKLEGASRSYSGEMRLRRTIPHDLDILLGWVRTPQEMVMWSGPTFTWPLNIAQLEKSLTSERRTWWTGIDLETGRAFGLASLLADHDSQSMRLGYIITDPAVRGQGRGRALVEAAVARGFEKTDFPLITLGVYAHNHRALGLYESLEFKPTGASIETVVGDETWQAMEMALSRDVWLRNDHTSSFH